MSAYAVFTRENTLDQAELDRYFKKVQATLLGFQVKILAAYGEYTVLEGGPIEGAVIAEFSTIEEAKRWYDSPEYQDALQHRLKGSEYRAFIVQGL